MKTYAMFGQAEKGPWVSPEVQSGLHLADFGLVGLSACFSVFVSYTVTLFK